MKEEIKKLQEHEKDVLARTDELLKKKQAFQVNWTEPLCVLLGSASAHMLNLCISCLLHGLRAMCVIFLG